MTNYLPRDPWHGATVVEIPVPSGRLIASDNLGRNAAYFDVEPPSSLNYGAGLDEWTRANAEQAQIAQAFCGNSCPDITRQPDGSLLVVSPRYDEEADQRVLEPGETAVAWIVTDLWSTMLTDYDHFRSHGGEPIETANDRYALTVYTIIDVEPGLYRWTVYSNDDDFDLHARGRIEYAKLEFIRPL